MPTLEETAREMKFNLEEMRREAKFKFKCGGRIAEHTFSLWQFLQGFASANSDPKKPSPCMPYVFANSVCHPKYAPLFGFQEPPINYSFFREGPEQVTKMKKGFIRKKEVQEPERQFLLFDDETFEEVTLEDEEGNEVYWGFDTDKDGSVWNAGQAYSTGRRIIFDSYFTERNEFATVQIWKAVDLKNCARAFNVPRFVIRDSDNIKGKGFGATGIETEISSGRLRDRLVILGVGGFDIPGSGEEITIINSTLVDPSGNKKVQGAHPYHKGFARLKEAMANFKPTPLEDILAMWHYAVGNGYLYAPYGYAKNPAMFKIEFLEAP